MAKADGKNTFISKYSDIIVSFGVILIVVMMIIPMPTWLLSLFIVFNISLALTILLVAMYNQNPLEFSIFPALLLIMTLFRLALNISSTRLILLYGDAGEVIEQFGNFVVGGNPIVGLIVFLILVIIQFLVITKGAERVAEVAARFTLDAMPGKQMAIDADLNAGLINDMEARQRRIDVQRQADFYGAMDGATKFVKGDAIAGIIITIINITGGIIIGTFQLNMGSIGEVAVRFTLLTVGDGLVSQIPALLLSTATGIIVTKAASEENLGDDLVSQIFENPKVLTITGVFLVLLALVPGLPFFPFASIGAFLLYIAYLMRKTAKDAIDVEEIDEIEAEVEESKRPENVYNLLNVDTLELELGYGLIPMVDTNQGGDLLDRVILIRRQIAIELGIVVPPVRIRDNMQLEPNKYLIKLKGVVMATGELMLDRLLAMNPGEELLISGIQTIEPAFGLPAIWIEEEDQEEAEIAGCTVVDPPSVLSTHLTEFIKSHATEIISRQDVQNIINHVKETAPSVVDEVIPRLLSLSEVHRIIINLLNERVPVRDMVTIFEAIGDYSGITKDLDILTEYVRQAISRQIINTYLENDTLNVLTLSPETETLIRNSLQETDSGNYLALEPKDIQLIAESISEAVERLSIMGLQPVILTPPIIRLYFRRLIERNFPAVPVLSYNEIPQNVNIEVVGTVTIR